MEITEIQIFPIRQQDTLLGFGSFVLGNFIRVSSVGIHTTREGGLRLVFPAKKVGNGFVYYCQPVSPEVKEEIEAEFEKKAREIGLFSL